MNSFRKFKEIFQKSNIYLVVIVTILFVLILSYISYHELQREKNYLWELARSEGLNIAFSIQTLGSEFILNRDILQEVLDLFQKEGITFIDVVDRSGIIRISTDEQRTNQQVEIHYPGSINYIQTHDLENRRILQIIKPFDFDDRFSSDLFGYLFLQDKYLLIGINLEGYYMRYNQIKQRVMMNYFIILMLSLLGVYMIFRVQESLVVKRTLNNMKDYTTKLLETMDSGVISVNKQNIIKTFNRKSEQIFQLTKDEVIGKDAEEILPIQVKDKSIYQLGLQEGEKIEEEIELITKNHIKKILEVNTSMLSGESDQTGGMVILVRDISRFKRLSEEMNRNKRLASLGKLSSGIAHEIRNPLSSIRGLAQFLFQSCTEKDERRADLKIILDEVDRLNQLINEILDFSRPKKLDISQFSLQEIIKELVQLLKLESKEKEISFQLVLSQKEQFIDADRNQVRQALMNILLNSIQAIPQKGGIVISLEKSTLKDENMIQIIVQDNGVGIDSTDLSHIFDPFFTTRSNGSGLGLSIAYNIIELHQGTIKVESEKGKGTKMSVFLPIRRNREIE
jgi:two-component system, NtrC family, sensor histidine kinase HydH